jgi:hypothetical protein
MTTFWETVKEKLVFVLITTVVSIATIYSDKLTGAIKTEVNKADQRPSQQEKIAKDLSTYIFAAENYISYARDDLTTKEALTLVAAPYNTAIDALRNNEYVYLAAVYRYWGKEEAALLEALYVNIRSLDKASHAFNPEYLEVVSGKATKADANRLAPLVKNASEELAKLQTASKNVLSRLAAS